MKLSFKYISFNLQYKSPAILVILILISLLISLQNIILGINEKWGGHYTFYNNYIIFKNSFAHLIEHKNLYEKYLNEYVDFYKYSPTFALLMGAFYFLPEYLGLFFWNAINIFVLYYSIKSLKLINASKKMLLLFFVIFDLILSVQNSQSNGLLAGLTIFAYNKLEKSENFQASLLIILGTFIKLYSIVGCLLFLLYPNKLKSMLYLLICFTLFFIAPLLLINFNELIWQYKNWYHLLKVDQSKSIGMSAYKFTQLFLPDQYFKNLTLLFGFFVLMTPLLKIEKFIVDTFRLHYLSLMLIWMVVFNYKAESPTYIIAMIGIGIWFFSSKYSHFKVSLIILTLFFTSIWFTDLIPDIVKENFFDQQFVKTCFPIIILFKIAYELVSKKNINYSVVQNQTSDTSV